ncbi:MAG: endonuclease [Muribaculaceae bacterium]|nr:endonuclease [Muribaculaceae bacterium]
MRYTNILRLASIAMAMAICQSANAGYPAGYYNSLKGKCGAELMSAIKALCVNHKEISYSSGTWNAFKSTDVRVINGQEYWWDMYSNNNVLVSSGHPGMNVEHSVANSWWGGTKNAAYKDIVHLNPSDQTANSRKSNYPICEIGSVSWTNNVTTVGSPKSGQGGGSSYGYEPCDEYKGDFARVFMYMFTTYDDLNWKYTWMIDKASGTMFASWARDLVLRWHAKDPVSEKERKRNDGVEKEQGNRNPFIDLPDLADHIWGKLKNVPYGSTDPGPGSDEEYRDEYNWLDQSSTTLDDGWTFENEELPSELSYIWTWSSNNSKYYLKSSAYLNGTPYQAKSYAFGPEISLKDANSAKMTFDHAAKFQTNFKQHCGVAVRDMETGETSKVEITNWPAAGSWTFVKSNEVDLTPWLGKKVRVGFVYGSTPDGADTWEVCNLNLKVVRSTSSITAPETEDDSELVEVWGNNILAPNGARIFDMNGREVSGKNLNRGIYIVVKPTFSKAVKIMIK